MKKTLLILGITIISFAGNAQNNSKEEKIKQLLELSGSGKIGLQVMNQMMDSFKKSFSAVPQEFWEEAKQEMKADDITNLITPIYAKYYTETDIDQLINFLQLSYWKKNGCYDASGCTGIDDDGTTMGKRNWRKSFCPPKRKRLLGKIKYYQ